MPKCKDLTNMRFGRLTALYPVKKDKIRKWHCRCDCGNEIDVITGSLIRGNSTSCGICVKKERRKDISGKQFGSWLVLHHVYDNMWMCRCLDCGTEREVNSKNLLSGLTKSCGCSHNVKKPVVDLVGQVFGKLTVVRYVGNSKWLCKCSCGSDKDVVTTTTKLKTGHTRSCGCLWHEPKQVKPLPDIVGTRFGKWTVVSACPHEPNVDIKWHCKCDCGNEADVFQHNLFSGASTSCGSCGASHSKVELEILDFVNTLGHKFTSNRNILDGKEIDIYNDELKLGIEYNGSVYHASLNAVYTDKSKNYHQQKFLLAKAKGIHLINIFDVDYEQNKDKILAYLKDTIKPEHRLYARKCNIQLIDKQVAWNFYDKYHLQGKSYMSQINYGLFFQDELIADMGFGKLRMKNANKKDCYELHRYCVRHGYTVVGGADKLLKCFEKNCTPKYLLSYSDNDYFVGGMYTKLGFSDSGQISVPYYWVNGSMMLKREQCQPKRLKVQYPELYKEAIDNNASNKEDYIMTSLGYCKVYRAGNTKWEKYYDNL